MSLDKTKELVKENRKLILCPALPFNGNKRNWINILKKQFEKYNISEDTVICDLFGGSGILAHFFAWRYPNNKVIYNDFDHYLDLFNKLDKINEMKAWGVEFMNEKGYKKNDKINMEDKEIILQKLIELFGDKYEEDEKLFNVICANWCFSGRNNLNGFLYNKLSINPYKNNLDEYILPNIEVVNMDYSNLIDKLKDDKVFYVLDPPYLSTSKSFYDNYWGIEKTCDIIELCLKNECILFESDKSEILPLFELIERFGGSKKKINKKSCSPKSLGGRSNSKDYYVLFNLDLDIVEKKEEKKETEEKIKLTPQEIELIKKLRSEQN